MTLRPIRQLPALAFALMATLSSTPALAEDEAALRARFEAPPAAARPLVWYRFIGPNVTVAGVEADMAWFDDIGIGGLQFFTVDAAVPSVVDPPVRYMDATYRAAISRMGHLAQRYGMELGLVSSPGWSLTGGPWVPPEDGMKKIVWSTTSVAGGTALEAPLATPPNVTGVFQDLDDIAILLPVDEGKTHYQDVAVLAVPAAADPAAEPAAVRFADAPAEDAAHLSDGLYADARVVPTAEDGSPGTIEIDYAEAVTVRGWHVHLPGEHGTSGLVPVLERATDEGWEKVAEAIPAIVPVTVAFEPVTAATFRVRFDQRAPTELAMIVPSIPTPLASGAQGAAPGPAADGGQPGLPSLPEGFDPSLLADLPPGADLSNLPGGIDLRAILDALPPGVDMSNLPGLPPGLDLSALLGPEGVAVSEMRLTSLPVLDQAERKAGFLVEGLTEARGHASPNAAGIDPADVVDLTDRMGPDGTLDWTAPPGRDWTVLRLGATLTGANNGPTSAEATGLEVDKYDAAAVRRYAETYLASYARAVGAPHGTPGGFAALLSDSIEAGPSNWSAGVPRRFESARGYDPAPWLPVLAGIVVGDAASSEAFLRDWRRTLGEMLVSEHYGTLAEVAREQGLRYCAEALETQPNVLGVDTDIHAQADVPMAAIWYPEPGTEVFPRLLGDMLSAASAANVMGRPVVAAESFTTFVDPWGQAPSDLRPIADLAFAHGITLPVVHTAPHQPDDRAPGMSLLTLGQMFSRHDAWATHARAWTDYLARTSALMQSGRPAVDVAYLFGSDVPVIEVWADGPPADLPQRHAFDLVTEAMLVKHFAVAEDGSIVTAGGARYAVLQIGAAADRLSLAGLEAVARLIEGGATVVGPRPIGPAGLGDDADAFRRLADRLWSNGIGADVEAALDARGIATPFTAADGALPPDVLWRGRILGEGGTLVFVTNQGDKAVTFDARLPGTGWAVDLFQAADGNVKPAAYAFENAGTRVPIHLEAGESVVLARVRETETRERRAVDGELRQVSDIAGPWQVTFEAGRGAPDAIVLDSLASLSRHEDEGTRFFSGVATYRTTFEAPEAQGVAADDLFLVFTDVADIARVRVNDTEAGFAWTPPYRVPIGHLLRAGANTLEVEVANLWVNRLVGDARSDGPSVAFTLLPIYDADEPLRPSGLIGPVRLQASGRSATDAAAPPQ